MDWTPIIWAIIWIIAGALAVGLIIWIVFASIAAHHFRKVSKSLTSKTGDPFDAPFFRNHRDRW